MFDYMKRFIIIHYGEIGLKGANFEYFKEKLRKRIKFKLENKFHHTFDVVHVLRRFLIALPEGFNPSVDQDLYVELLRKIFAIKNFMFVYEGAIDLNILGNEIWSNLDENTLLLPSDRKTFCVRCKRSMDLSFRSIDAERQLGAVLLKSGIDLKVKMKNPDLLVNVEFFNGHSYFAYAVYKGVGGLSGNSQSKLVSLMSSGIDSPVASYRMMRRGARVIFAHFHGYPYTGSDEMEQVEDLVEILSDYQFDTKLYMLPFGQVQKEISLNDKIPDKVRTVLYRRLMFRIAELIAKKEGAKGLITGDSYGQVASQTPNNLFAVHDASSIPVFQPLISFDKEEIITISKEIGTFEISKQECKESCTVFAPASPELKADVYDMREYESFLDVDYWVKKIFDEADVKMW